MLFCKFTWYAKSTSSVILINKGRTEKYLEMISKSSLDNEVIKSVNLSYSWFADKLESSLMRWNLSEGIIFCVAVFKRFLSI